MGLSTECPPRQDGSGGKVRSETLHIPKPDFVGLEDLSLSGRLMFNRILELNVNSIYEEKCNCLRNWNICICLTRPFSPHGQSS